MNFRVEESFLLGSEGELFLKSDNGHCHGIESVRRLLKSEIFRQKNAALCPIYTKALKMMQNRETGPVIIDWSQF